VPRSFLLIAHEWEKTAYKLGLKPDEFWKMEKREFITYVQARTEQLQDEFKLQRRLTAELQSTIANFVPMRSKKSKVWKAEDFMPRERKVLTDEQFDAQLDKMVTVFGGKKGGHK